MRKQINNKNTKRFKNINIRKYRYIKYIYTRIIYRRYFNFVLFIVFEAFLDFKSLKINKLSVNNHCLLLFTDFIGI